MICRYFRDYSFQVCFDLSLNAYMKPKVDRYDHQMKKMVTMIKVKLFHKLYVSYDTGEIYTSWPNSERYLYFIYAFKYSGLIDGYGCSKLICCTQSVLPLWPLKLLSLLSSRELLTRSDCYNFYFNTCLDSLVSIWCLEMCKFKVLHKSSVQLTLVWLKY